MDLQNKVLEKSNQGLDIIRHYYPQADLTKNFKVREEKTSSASMIRLEDGVYVVTDFGDNSKPRNGIAVCAKEEGISFKDALLLWADKLGVLERTKALSAEIRKLPPTEVDYLEEFDENGFYFRYNTEFKQDELDVLGPLVTNEVCKRYRLFSVKFYAKKKETEIVQMSSTEHYPIFAFVNKTKEGKEWIKVLQPKAQDKKFRFFYVGGRPKDFIFGLDYIEKVFNEKQPKEEDFLDEDTGDTVSVKRGSTVKLNQIVIGSGDRDSLNLAGAGEFVIWQNSETASLEPWLYSKLTSKAYKIINVPDIDKTGRTQGAALAMQYMDLYTAWLPDYLSKSKDFRGNPKKDFLDFCMMHRHSKHTLKNEVRLLLDNAKTCQFWDVSYTKTSVTYQFNNVNAYYFLSLAGFSRMEAPENRNEYIFIFTENHLIHRINYQDVKDYVNNFLEQKQRILGERIIPNALRNMLYNSNKMTENSLINLPKKTPDFTDYSNDWQLLFFKNQVWRITSKGIVDENIEKLEYNVWSNDLIDEKVEQTYRFRINGRKIFIDTEYFRIFKDKEDEWNIEIIKKDCDFLNYLINVSRVHWAKEESLLAGKTQEERDKYNENRFNIAGELLSEDEIHEQKQHLINKIFIYGYLMHRYKDPSKPWAVYLMDNEVVSDDESHGGTGKSLFSNSPRIFMDTKVLASRNPKLFDNNFIFDGVTEHTDYFLFDDASRYFQFDNLYTTITGDLNVNPKNNQPYMVPFDKSPKFAISTNYSLRETSPSTMRRLLVGAFSDWYHYESDGRESHDPVKDFGKKMFTGWDDYQWNCFFNFAAQACRFYLETDEKISAPDANVRKRNSLAAMGVSFQSWADRYLIDFVNTSLEGSSHVVKADAVENLKTTERVHNSISPQAFTKKLKAWCVYNDITLNPKEKITHQDGRILIWQSELNKATEHYYLLKNKVDDNQSNAIIEAKDELDGLKF